VKEEKGVKIYFDPVETAARMRINGSLVRGCYDDADNVFAKYTPPEAEEWAAETLCWHVAAHEVMVYVSCVCLLFFFFFFYACPSFRYFVHFHVTLTL
jgi:hypothetical protein